MVDQVLLKFWGEEFGANADDGQEAEDDGTAPIGREEGFHAFEDLPFLQAAWAAFVVHRQAEAALGAAGRVEWLSMRIDGWNQIMTNISPRT